MSTPNIADLDPLEAEMLKQAEAFDSGEDVSTETLDKLTVEAEETEKANEPPDDGDSPSGEGDEDDLEHEDELDDEGNPIEKKPEGTDEAEAAKKAAEEEARKKEEEEAKAGDKSDYAKAREKREKERERLSKSWQDLDAEKERVRSTEAELKKRETELAEREKQLSTPRYTADDYEAVAQKLETEGKDELAAQARQQAEALRKGKGDQLVQTLEGQKKQQEEFITSWNENLDAQKKENPDLLDDESELAKAVKANLKEIPVLSYMPDGINWAVKLAKLQEAAGGAGKLREELDAAQKEIERLTELTSTEGGGLHSRPKPKKFEEMSLAEQEAHLERLANEADAR